MIERFLERWRVADGWVAAIERVVVVVAALTMVGAIFLQSVLRFTINRNLFGANELAVILLVWVGFFSASLATREMKHIVVDAVPRLLGERTAADVLNAAISLGTGLFLVYLAAASLAYFNSPSVQFRTTTALGWPAKYVVVCMPITLSLMALRFVQIACEQAATAAGLYPHDKRRRPTGIADMLPANETKTAAPR